MQHYLFNSHVCKHGESVATYIAELKRLPEHCEFAGTLENMLCDCASVIAVQCRLLAEPAVT